MPRKTLFYSPSDANCKPFSLFIVRLMIPSSVSACAFPSSPMNSHHLMIHYFPIVVKPTFYIDFCFTTGLPLGSNAVQLLQCSHLSTRLGAFSSRRAPLYYSLEYAAYIDCFTSAHLMVELVSCV